MEEIVKAKIGRSLIALVVLAQAADKPSTGTFKGVVTEPPVPLSRMRL